MWYGLRLRDLLCKIAANTDTKRTSKNIPANTSETFKQICMEITYRNVTIFDRDVQTDLLMVSKKENKFKILHFTR